MKKALTLLMVFMVAVMWSSTSFSADKYVSGNIGIVWPNDAEIESTTNNLAPANSYDVSFDSGITLLGALGCDYGDYRMEGELGYQSGDIASLLTTYPQGESDTTELTGDLEILSLLMNGYYDIDLGGVDLYATAGVGVAQVSASDLTYNDGRVGAPEYTEHETTLAYQIGAGFAIPVADDIMLDARYRYFSTTEFSFAASEYNTTISSHSGLLGLRVNL